MERYVFVVGRNNCTWMAMEREGLAYAMDVFIFELIERTPSNKSSTMVDVSSAPARCGIWKH